MFAFLNSERKEQSDRSSGGSTSQAGHMDSNRDNYKTLLERIEDLERANEALKKQVEKCHCWTEEGKKT